MNLVKAYTEIPVLLFKNIKTSGHVFNSCDGLGYGGEVTVEYTILI